MVYSSYPCLFLLLISNILCSDTWNVTSQLNPGCNLTYPVCSSFNLVYIRSENDTSAAHFILSGSGRLTPSILVILSSDPKSNLDLDWDKLISTDRPVEAFAVHDAVQSYALTFDNLIEYNDTEDNVSLSAAPDGSYSYTFHPFNQMDWRLLTEIADFDRHPIEGKELFQVVYYANRSISNSSNSSDVRSIFGEQGRLQLKFMVSPLEQHNPTLPRLKFVPGLTVQFELSLTDLQSNFSQARFGLDLLLISNDPLDPIEDYRLTSLFSVNDELAPGIFELTNINLNEHVSSDQHKPSNVSSPTTGYLQSRPVCYTDDRDRHLKHSRNANLGKARRMLLSSGDDAWKSALQHTLPYLYYGKRIAPSADHLDGVGLRVQNISFGTPEDGFYQASKYIVWTATFGIGEPPMEPLSSLLIGLLSLSVVLILGSMVFGTVLILIFRRRYQTNTFERLREPHSPPITSVNT